MKHVLLDAALFASRFPSCSVMMLKRVLCPYTCLLVSRRLSCLIASFRSCIPPSFLSTSSSQSRIHTHNNLSPSPLLLMPRNTVRPALCLGPHSLLTPSNYFFLPVLSYLPLPHERERFEPSLLLPYFFPSNFVDVVYSSRFAVCSLVENLS